jgi:hypothetical protein
VILNNGNQKEVIMECPSCHYIRQVKDRIVPEWQCPQCGVAYAKVKAAISKVVKARLTSGQETQFNKVKLYDLSLVRRLETLRQLAARNFAGYTTGLGFWGSLEWVAIGSLVTGAIENSVSNQMAQEGMNQLAEIGNLSKRIRDTAEFIHVSVIENIKYPDIGLWRAIVTDKSIRRELIHIASEYVFVEEQGKETAVFWDKIEQYELTESV